MLVKRPKIIVNKSLTGIFAQFVSLEGKTLCGVKYVFKKGNKKPTEQAFEFGEDFGKRAVGQKAKEIVFDRNGNLYHGQVKAFAEGLRKSGLQF